MIENLLKYQERDKDLRAYEVQLVESEERKKAMSAKKYLDGVEESLAKLETRAGELNQMYVSVVAELENIKAQDKEFGIAMETLSDEGSAGYLLKKTDEILAAIKRLSQETNSIAAEIQSVLKKYATLKANTKAAQAQYAEYGKKYNDKKAELKPEMAIIEKDLEELKKGVDPALMERYLKKRSEKLFPIVFEVGGNSCGFCNMELSMSEVSKLKNGEIIECEHCRRLLYKSGN